MGEKIDFGKVIVDVARAEENRLRLKLARERIAAIRYGISEWKTDTEVTAVVGKLLNVIGDELGIIDAHLREVKP